LLVVGTTLAIAPMHLEFRELALSLTLGFLSFALIAPWRSRVIDGRRSLILLMIYGVYLAMLWRSA
jgi:hypothetical protein